MQHNFQTVSCWHMYHICSTLLSSSAIPSIYQCIYTYTAKGDHWSWKSVSFPQCGRRYRSKVTVRIIVMTSESLLFWHQNDQVACVSFALSDTFRIQWFITDYNDAASIVLVTIIEKCSQKYNNSKFLKYETILRSLVSGQIVHWTSRTHVSRYIDLSVQNDKK